MQQPAPRVVVTHTTALEDSIREIVRERAQLHYFSEISQLALQQFDRLETLTAEVLDALVDPRRPIPNTTLSGDLAATLSESDIAPQLRLSTQSASQQNSRLARFYDRMQRQAASVEADFLKIAERLGGLESLRLSTTEFVAGIAQVIDGVDSGRGHLAELAEAHRMAACRLSQLEVDARKLVAAERKVLQAYGDLG